ncbi:BMP family lipoprotein [Hungatella effluvii]|uniref:BMP family lipoprotein n=1 Tax=Hungatella effluvii TaxID=1096246 RepID=UPI0022E19AB6|nr:BMP family ABC transporter substrate-binding protein [Hungatella effluvii]
MRRAGRMAALAVAAGLIVTTAGGCGKKIEEPTEAKAAKIGVVYTTTGLGDNNFNDMVNSGMEKAKAELNISYDYSEPSSNGEVVTMLREFAQTGEYDLVLALSSDAAAALEQVAGEYPDQNFTIIDTVLEADNVSSISKNGADQSFLCGVLAGYLTKEESLDRINGENKIGAVMGVDIPLLNAVVAGFEAGARYANPDVEVLSGVVGSFNDPAKAKEIADSMYRQGVDIILQGAGGSGMGVFNAAQECGGYAMGTGVNQNAISPDEIVATATFELPSIVYEEVKTVVDGTWKSGPKIWGLREGAVGYSVEGSNVKVPQEILDKVDAANKWFIDENIVLPSSTDEVDNWVSQNVK